MPGPLMNPYPGLLLTIRGLLPSLNEQEQKVGEYVLKHPYEVVHLPINDLAQCCGVGDTTIFRFCKKVGADGFQDFKICLAQELEPESPAIYAAVEAGDPLAEAARKVIADDVKALEDTLRVLDLAALDRAADVLLAARRVDIYGSGGAAVAALELQYKLMRVGVRAVAHTDTEMQVISATLLTPTDAAVGISHSGTAHETRHALEAAKESGARIIAITNHPASPIARLADISLCTAAQEALAHGYPLGARVAQVALTDVLYACMALKRRAETERSLDRIARALYHRQP
jgi:RpiR family carbohydrate utilization transcriptional regulator